MWVSAGAPLNLLCLMIELESKSNTPWLELLPPEAVAVTSFMVGLEKELNTAIGMPLPSLQSACSLANQELRGEYLVVGLPILSSMISTARATPRSARIICPSSSARRRTPPSVTALWIARPSISAVSLL